MAFEQLKMKVRLFFPGFFFYRRVELASRWNRVLTIDYADEKRGVPR
jgi:hypothetical protein